MVHYDNELFDCNYSQNCDSFWSIAYYYYYCSNSSRSSSSSILVVATAVLMALFTIFCFCLCVAKTLPYDGNVFGPRLCMYVCCMYVVCINIYVYSYHNFRNFHY